MAKALFDWDAGNLAKCQTHGVSIDEIEALFLNGGQVLPDLAHSVSEDRFVAVGRSQVGRPLFVVFTRRRLGDLEHIRPVSARYMHAKEVRRYEEATKRTDESPTVEDR